MKEGAANQGVRQIWAGYVNCSLDENSPTWDDGCLATYKSVVFPPDLVLPCIGRPTLSSKFRNFDKRIGGAPFGGFTPLSCLKLSHAELLGINYSASIVSLPASVHGLLQTSWCL